jgi:hypothetical protein
LIKARNRAAILQSGRSTPANKLAKYPPSTQRVFNPQGCGQAA